VTFSSWLAYGIAVLMVTISIYCVLRIVLAAPMGRRNHHDINVAHLLMGLAMAGMFVPRWRVLPVGVWEVVFAAVGTYFLILSMRFVAQRGVAGVDDEHVHHVSHYAIHLAIWQLDALGRLALQRQRVPVSGGSVDPVGQASVASASTLPWLAPRTEICSRVAMCLVMGYMLVLMM
jgi:hypothetical protein